MEEKIIALLVTSCEQLYSHNVQVQLSRPDTQFGDYATNVAMQLAKPLNRNPRDIAQEIATFLEKDTLFSSVGVAGPGFINMTVTDSVLWELAVMDAPQLLKGMKILVEYSDPNPFKPLHAGHLYTTLVGDSIARIVQSAGAETMRLNFGGDVGLHVGRSLWSMIKWLGGEYPEKLADIAFDDRPSWMGDRYVEGNTAYEEDETARSEIIAVNKRVYALHDADDHDSPFAQIYWTCREWSYTYFMLLYQQLGVVPFDRFIPESEVTPLGLATVHEQLNAGVFEQSDGAIVFNGEQYGLHTRVFINSAGLPTYETKDVGLSLTKWQDYHFDESVIITDKTQLQYMQVVLKAIAQFAPDASERTRHLTHGTVKLKGGIKMSSRRGNTVMALDILESARMAAAESDRGTSEDSILAAVKYSFLKNRVGSDIIYDPEESVSLEGNSGPYLQYAHARACSILKKLGHSKDQSLNVESAQFFDEQERLLVTALSQRVEVYASVSMKLSPHEICTYLYDLSQIFNRFYEQSKVVGDPREHIRSALVMRYKQTLADGLSLLGIIAPEYM